MSDYAVSDLRLVALPGQLVQGQVPLRDDMTLVSATLMRRDDAAPALLTGVRAMQSQPSRLANPMRALETASEGLV